MASYSWLTKFTFRVLISIVLIPTSIATLLLAFEPPQFSARMTFSSIAVDDYYVFEKNPLYIARNDQHPESVATLVTGPVYGSLVNNGQTVGYAPGAGAPPIYVDTFSYKWCELVDPPYDCSNVATVTLLVIGSDDSQNFGSCKMGRPNPSAPDSVARPVNVTNGNMWLTQGDYSLPGLGEPIEISRTYNSRLYASGIFGYGWTTKYDQFLTIYGDNRILKLTMSDGRAAFFGRSNSSTYFRSISADLKGRIDQAPDNTYTLTSQEGRTQKFDSGGKLVWQRDRNGNQTTLSYDTSGFLVSVTDATGQVLTLTPNANGRIQQISDSIGTIASYEYDPTGVYLKTVTYPDGSKYKFEYINKTVSGQVRTFLATVKDALDNVLETHAYDTQGRATSSEVDGGVEKYTIAYTTSSYTTVVDGLGRSTKYYFQSQQKKKQVTKIEGACSCGSGGTETSSFAYDESTLNMKNKTDALGNLTTYEYDAEANLIKITDVLGIQKYTYNSLGQVLTYKDRIDQNTSNDTVVNTYSSTGDLLTTTDALGYTTTLTYTTLGQLATVTDARSNTTTLTHDTQGRLTQVKDANNKNTDYAYDARARVTSTTNALNETTTFEYDLNNRLKKVIHPDTNYAEFTYDLAGRRTAAKDERGNTTTYGYDSAYRLTSVTDSLSHTTSYGYDLMSNMTSQTDALTNVTNYQYDDFNRLKKIIYPPATPTSSRLEETLTYDKLGKVKTRVDTAGRTTTHDYDSASRLIKITDPLLKLTQFEYNLRSQMIKVKDALNQEYVFTYDDLGRELAQTRAGTTRTFQYDSVGNRTQRTDYMGRVTNYTFDALNRLTNINYVPASQGSVTFNYDDLSRLTSAVNSAGTVAFTYDNRSRVKTTTDVFGHVLEYSYDPNSNRTQLKLDGNVHTTYNYNTANLLATLADDASQNFTYAYDFANKLTSRAMPNGITSTFDHDGLSRLTQLKHQSASSTLTDNDFAYNPANQITQIAELSQTSDFTYDNVNRLTAMTNGTSNESYAFDGLGNRTASHRSAGYTYQPFNRMTATASATMAYDSNGNLSGKSDATNSWIYSWDYENRMTAASTAAGTVRYVYDGLGRRVERSMDGTLDDMKFVYDGLDVVMDDDFYTGVTKYQNGPGIDDKLSLKNGGVTKYFLHDHLGSTVALTDSSGAVTETTSYDSFGNHSTNLSTRYQYTGREYDSFSGFYYYRARWYDANLGRFVSEDPIGFAGGDINLFGYVKSNSVNRTDPLGLLDAGDADALRRAEDLRRAAAGAGIGAGAGAGFFSAVGAAGGISVSAAPAAAVAVGAAGLGAGAAIGYYPGQWTANHPSNPFVRGPLNPFGTPGPQQQTLPMPQAAKKPTCEPTLSTPWYRNPPMPAPFSNPDDEDDDNGCREEIQACSRLCSRVQTDGDGRHIYGGSISQCMKNCLPERCGGEPKWKGYKNR